MIFFAFEILLKLIRIFYAVLSSLHLQPHEICFPNILTLFILFIILNTLEFTTFLSPRKHICVDKSSKGLQFPFHLSRLIMNE